MAESRSRMSKSELFTHFAERFGIKRTEAGEFFDELQQLTEQELERHSGQSLHPESPQVRPRSPLDDDERAENGSFRLLRIALAMTSAWSRSTPPAANCWATASVSNMRAALPRRARHGRNSPCRLVDSGRLRGEADPA